MKVGRLILTGLVFFLTTLSSFCAKKVEAKMKFSGAKGEVKLMTLDPGHFHAALVQKTMHEQISPTVYVYAPVGPDVEDHLRRIEVFNKRLENPTNWEQKVYTDDDFLGKMLAEKLGNVVIISGNNEKKTEYIKACVDAGLNVLADKPMCIDGDDFALLEEAFASAKSNGVLLYDIMTERFEITTILQKELVQNKELFGELQKGTVNEPAVVKESVHHIFKYVAGNPIKRPAWYFDTTQQGEGIVDVATHLVDLVMWECFPSEAIDYEKDVELKKASRWPTMISRQQFKKVTRLDDFPAFLKEKLNDKGVLPYYANGEMIHTLKDIYARVSVKWDFEAQEGAKETHYSIIKGSKANVIIRQGKEQNYRPNLYIEAASGTKRAEVGHSLKEAILTLQSRYPGVELEEEGDTWHVQIPNKYHIGHEAHFREVMEKYLGYLVEGKLPEWEVPNMKAKYYTTTTAFELASL
ncbi:MAG: oxidoreductase [Planctomycetota bacterium]|nr:MAG: oxidoreductase [Planctomycetota bacterium]